MFRLLCTLSVCWGRCTRGSTVGDYGYVAGSCRGFVVCCFGLNSHLRGRKSGDSLPIHRYNSARASKSFLLLSLLLLTDCHDMMRERDGRT